ncbi:TetR/AcrR family transcriptional regulator [Clostridium sp. DL1XJH146]
MDIKTKRKLEREEMKEKRKMEVVKAATIVFMEKGIENAKMVDIADRAQVGVASVYRYFSTKTDLAIEVATNIWKNEINRKYLEEFKSIDNKEINGKEKIKQLLIIFIDIYENYPNYLRFIEYFDNYIVKENISKEKLKEYEKNVINLKPIFLSYLDEGKKDLSIRVDIDKDILFVTIVNSMMALSQKFIVRGNILNFDKEIKGKKQLELFIDMIIRYLSG